MNDKEQAKTEQKKYASNKALTVIALRNKFFYILYRQASLVFLVSLASFCVSLSFLVFFVTKPVEPRYIPVNEDATFFRLTPLSECKSDAEVQKFVVGAIKGILKYDYINYATQIQEAASYFTTSGWNAYLDEFGNSGTLTKVRENRLISTTEISNVPMILGRFSENINGVNVCAWDIRTNVDIMFIGERSQRMPSTFHIRVVRNSILNNPYGLGIQTIIIKNRENAPS